MNPSKSPTQLGTLQPYEPQQGRKPQATKAVPQASLTSSRVHGHLMCATSISNSKPAAFKCPRTKNPLCELLVLFCDKRVVPSFLIHHKPPQWTERPNPARAPVTRTNKVPHSNAPQPPNPSFLLLIVPTHVGISPCPLPTAAPPSHHRQHVTQRAPSLHSHPPSRLTRVSTRLTPAQHSKSARRTPRRQWQSE